MTQGFVVISVFCLYMSILFYIAQKVEQGDNFFRRISTHPFVYAAALGIYCTTWTYYGSVGKSATSGMIFLTMYLGPTMIVFSWWFMLRKLVRIRHTHRITSIADFISARYGKSQGLAALVTVMALVGVIPYIALQLRATITTFNLIAASGGTETVSWLSVVMRWLLIGLMILFTIIFGARKLDPTESHKGMLLSVAIQSIVQLVALLCAGIFVVYFLFNGFGDILAQLEHSPFYNVIRLSTSGESYLIWGTYLLLAMSAVMFLPRQFHIAVVENSNEDHIRTAMWVFPLYMFLITFFVVPIAMGGLLKGLPIQLADTFVLRLPLLYGKFWLALVVFIGGISAAVSMIMISSITIATMFTNHLLVPGIEMFKQLNFLKKHLLKCRWAVITIFILLGYLFEQLLGESYMLVSIGLISFAGVLQFAPAVIGGLYWRRANKTGAILGLGAGFLVWFYTLFLPALIKSGWATISLLHHGPWGIAFLKPENLFGVSLSNNLAHAVFWSMLFNIGFYIFGSIYSVSAQEEQQLADEFVDALVQKSLFQRTSKGALISLMPKIKCIEQIFQQYFSHQESKSMLTKCLQALDLNNREKISVLELAELKRELEKILTGALGSATAHKVVIEGDIFSSTEEKQLQQVYAEMLATLMVSPQELADKIDYYRERENLLAQHAQELEKKIVELNENIKERQRSEGALKLSEEKLAWAYRQLKETQQQLIQSSKMVAIGQLAAGVSHELNQPLTGIKGFAQVISMELKSDHSCKKDLDRIIEQANRMDEIIKSMRSFARKSGAVVRELDINKPIEDSLALLNEQLRINNIQITKTLAQNLPKIQGDHNQLEQVFLNLITNARDAIRKTGNVESAQLIITTLASQDNKHIEISFQDTGCGIPKRELDQIFNPFFTTKSPDGGMGLGLSIVYRIIEDHKGQIQVESEVGKGTTFKIILPTVNEIKS